MITEHLRQVNSPTVNTKVNTELLSRQTEMALKISSYAHYMCLLLFPVFRFALQIKGPMPFALLIYFLISFSNNQLFRLHRRILIVSIVFFAASRITTLLIVVINDRMTKTSPC